MEDLVGLKAMRASPGENEGVAVGTVAGVVTRDEVPLYCTSIFYPDVRLRVLNYR